MDTEEGNANTVFIGLRISCILDKELDDFLVF